MILALGIESIMGNETLSISVSLTYLRGLKIPESTEEQMPVV